MLNLSVRVASTTDEPTVSWVVVDRPTAAHSDLERPALFVSEEQTGDRPSLVIYRTIDGLLIQEHQVANYRLRPDRIEIQVLDSEFIFAIEIRLLGLLAAIRAHLNQRIALHSSVVRVGDRTIALLAGNGGGKTSLTATALAQGSSLISDDLLILGNDMVAQLGSPSMRMWPETARWFHGDVAGLDIVHPSLTKLNVPIGEGFGCFAPEGSGLDALVFLDRDEAGRTMARRLDPPHAHAAATSQLFLRGYVRSLGFGRSAFDLVGELTEQLPCIHFTSPNVELPRLTEVLDALMQSVELHAHPRSSS